MDDIDEIRRIEEMDRTYKINLFPRSVPGHENTCIYWRPADRKPESKKEEAKSSMDKAVEKYAAELKELEAAHAANIAEMKAGKASSKEEEELAGKLKSTRIS